MCFSEEASFSAAVVLGGIAVASFKTASKNPERYCLAALPLFFALQQAAEGVEWLYFKNIWGTLQGANAARDIYLFIALVMWPVWVPFSLWVAESNHFRKRALSGFLILGGVLGLYSAWKMFFFPVSANIMGHSIHYDYQLTESTLWIYAACAIIPWFISSLNRSNVLGVFYFIGIPIGLWFYMGVFTSVWCFFAAIVSVLNYWMLKASPQIRSSDIRSN